MKQTRRRLIESSGYMDSLYVEVDVCSLSVILCIAIVILAETFVLKRLFAGSSKRQVMIES